MNEEYMQTKDGKTTPNTHKAEFSLADVDVAENVESRRRHADRRARARRGLQLRRAQMHPGPLGRSGGARRDRTDVYLDDPAVRAKVARRAALSQGLALTSRDPDDTRPRPSNDQANPHMHGRNLLRGKPIPLSQIPDYSIDRPTGEEIFSDAFRARLKALNNYVNASGETIEGGLFYWDRDADFFGKAPGPDAGAGPAQSVARDALQDQPARDRRQRRPQRAALPFRQSESRLSRRRHRLSPIYRALHPLSRSASFPGRVFFHHGDSREVLPYLATHRRDLDFDIFNVDGGHTHELCRADISNCVRLANGGRGKHLLLDDINASWIFDIYCEFVSLGWLATETLFNDWEDVDRNVLARIL